MKISALIAIKPDHGWRDHIWSYIRHRYETLMPQLELCIVMDENEPFWKTRALNEAARKATGDIFLLADGDVIFHPNLLHEIERSIQNHPWVIPFTEGLRLREPVTKKILQKDALLDIRVSSKDIQEVDRTPGILLNAVKRSCFEAVGGLDERFRGWGHEDTALVFALDTICGRHYRIKGGVYHLWHPHASRTSLEHNRSLLQPYLEAKGQPIKMRRLIKERYQRF